MTRAFLIFCLSYGVSLSVKAQMSLSQTLTGSAEPKVILESPRGPASETQAQMGPISVHPGRADMEAGGCLDGSCSRPSTMVQPISPDLPRQISSYADRFLSPLSYGIKKVMNTLYQRCDAYDMMLGNDYKNPSFYNYKAEQEAIRENENGGGHRTGGYRGQAFKEGDLLARYESKKDFFSYDVASSVGGHPYTKKDYAPSCRDARKTPSVFKEDGTRPIVQMKNGHVDVNLFNASRNRTGGRFNTLDCSGYVSSVYLASGYRFYKKGSPSQTVTTNSLHDFRKNSGDACIKPVSFDSQTTLQPGDILLFENGKNGRHSMVIDQVGADPFALKEFPPDGSCESDLYIDDFNISVTQSGLFAGRPAISKGRFQDVEDQSSGRENAAMFSLAVAACEARKSGGRVSTVTDKISVLRHVGAGDPACFVHKPESHPDCVDLDSFACGQPWPAAVEGEECLKTCDDGSAS